MSHPDIPDETADELARRVGAFRALHSFILTAALAQPDESNCTGIMTSIGGFELPDLLDALDEDRVRATPFVLGDEMAVRVFVRAPSGEYFGLCHPPVRCLGLIPSDRLYQSWHKHAVTFTAPDDLSGLDES